MPGLPEWNEGPGRQRYGSARSVRSVRSASSATSAAGSQRSTVSMPAHLNRENLAGTRRVVAGQGPLYIGPWQEYTLSVLMAQDRRMAAAEGPEQGGGRDVHGGGGAVSPVGSYSTMDSRASSPWVPPATDQTGVITALFRHARNLKYNGPRYDRPWRAPRAAKPPLHSGGQLPTIPQVPGGMRQARVAQMQSIYGFNSGVDHALKEELERQKVSELKRRAKSIGVTPAQMDEVDDSDDPKGELVKMLLQASRAAAAAAAACPTTDGPDHLSELYVPQFDVPASRPSPKFARPSPLDTAGPLLPARRANAATVVNLPTPSLLVPLNLPTLPERRSAFSLSLVYIFY